MSNQVLDKIKDIQKELNELEVKKDLPQSQRVIASIVRLLDDSVSVDDQSLFQLFTDSDGKIRANASWFYEDSVMTDRKATYKVHPQNNLNLDIKLYGITKPSKRTIAWAQSLTPNFEDEPFNKNFNVGIDFIVPKSADRIIVVLSNNWVIRTLELKGKLTVTFQEILARWAEIKNFDNKTELHNILWESFDIQPLNKKFYSGISERFTLLRQYLVKEKVFDEKHASLFANRLLGRVIFCWFLDKKGIINPDQKYFDSESFENDNEYYKTKLERLFFGVLNTPIGDREFKDDVTPFLNGGLFEARKNDLYNDSKLSFPKNYFDDLFEFLSGYNFTTDESTSQFQQVAIDPEMLGRIFENLLAEMTEETGEQARKAKGAFYTPREIVDYMCKESLKEYLKTKIEKDEQLDQRLYQLIDAPDKDFQDQDHNWRRDWKPYKADILKALDELKVLDPACGSGAFPIGMLQLLVRVYERLEARFDSYKTKLGIIEKNIYGVDIEPMAVEIARLRAWLSIIVDEESDSKKIKPLPNLEFKFICANSLIDLDKNGNNTFGDDPELQEKLASIRDAYFNTESLNKKKKLRGDYEKLVTQGEGLFGESKKSKQLKTYRPFDNEAQAEFFDPQFMFGVRFFNIILANPPYIEFKKLKNKDLYSEYVSAKGKYDIYVLFFELSEKILNKDGNLVFITPTTFLKKDFGKSIRGHINSNFTITKILDFSDIQMFESAINYTGVFIFKKGRPEKYSFKYHKYKNSSSGLKPEIVLSTINNEVSDNFKEVISIDSTDLKDLNWNFQKKTFRTLFNKLSNNTKPLDHYTDEIFQGIASGKDEVFYIQEDQIKAHDLEMDLIKPIVKGKDVKAYNINWSGFYVIYPYDEDSRVLSEDTLQSKYPKVYSYLKSKKDLLSGRGYFSKSSKKWYELWNQRKLANFNQLRIVVPEISGNNNFSLTNKYLGNTKTYHILLKDKKEENYKFFIGLLNSTFANYVYKHITTPQAGGFFAYKTQFLKSIPILMKSDYIDKIASEVTLLENERDERKINEIRHKIDNLVMDLYELTKEEREEINKFINQ